VQPVPELRIVDDELWEAVKARQGVHQKRVERTVDGYRLNGTHRQRYLFSGLLRCAVCGVAYAITRKDWYGCASHRNRGTCENSFVIKRQELEARILVGLKDKLMAPALVKEFVAAFHAELNRRNAAAEAAYEASRRELGEIEKKISAILTAIENGIFASSTKERLLQLEERKRELRAMPPIEKAPAIHPRLAELYAEKVARLEEAVNIPEDRNEAAEILRSLVDEIRIGRMHPVKAAGNRCQAASAFGGAGQFQGRS
jgi:site-specific DNA recombinase